MGVGLDEARMDDVVVRAIYSGALVCTLVDGMDAPRSLLVRVSTFDEKRRRLQVQCFCPVGHTFGKSVTVCLKREGLTGPVFLPRAAHFRQDGRT